MADTDTAALPAEAAPAAAAPTPAPAPAAAAAKSRKTLVIGALAAVLVIGGGVGYWKWQQAKKHAEESEQSVEARLKKQLEARKENKAPIFVPMDEFLVNLPGGGGEHYLQAKLVLRTADANTEARIKAFLPMVRDRVIAVMSSRSVDELATVEGKDAMARDIALVINAIIEPQLTAIYILQQEPRTADLKNLERLGAIPKQTAGGGAYSAMAKEAAAQFWRVTEMDLPVQAVLFNSLVMQ